MTLPVLCHLLVGLPGSGKSTFAKQLNQQMPNSVIISTDAVRLRLYGDEKIQGNWEEIEEAVIEQIRLQLVAGFIPWSDLSESLYMYGV